MSAHKPATPLPDSDEALFLKADSHMTKWTMSASLDRTLWDATARLAHKGIAHPKLVAALRELCEVVEYARTHDVRPTSVESIEARALLAELGENVR